MKCAFTICTYSYLGLANTLRDSFIKFHKEYDFYIVIVDDIKQNYELVLADDILLHYLSDKDIEKMKFQYDVTEYSTSVKPYAISYFLSKGYELVAYLDPDIEFHSEFKELNDRDYCAYVTPHVLGLNTLQDADNEANIMKHGLFNCGFIAFRNCEKTEAFLKWWADRLVDYAFDDLILGTYTDQKWIDYITIHMNGYVYIIDNPGCNVAVWNIKNRSIKIKNNSIFVFGSNGIEKELVFVHYSGFDYNLLCNGIIKHSFIKESDYKSLKLLLLNYGNALLKNNHLGYIKNKYKYNFYTNGIKISKFNRRLYREAYKEHSIEDAFSSNGDFYKIVKDEQCISFGMFEPRKATTQNLNKKLYLLKVIFKFAKRVLGIDRYLELLKALSIYSAYEKQIFLLSKKK